MIPLPSEFGGDPLNPAAEPPVHTADPTSVVLVSGRSFCISAGNGDIGGGRADGVFAGDFRLVRDLRLEVDGAAVEGLAVEKRSPSHVRFVCRTPPGPRGSLVVLRERSLDHRLVERIEVRNHTSSERALKLRYTVSSDGAYIFAVKDGNSTSRPVEARALGSVLEYELELDVAQDVRVEAIGAAAGIGPRRGYLTWDVLLAPGATWGGELTVALSDVPVLPPVHQAEPGGEGDDDPWRGSNAVHCRSWWYPLDEAIARSVSDLDALRLPDVRGRQRPTIAAGAPWFMTIFGRDSLLTSWMVLPVDPDLALGVLDALAATQGTTLDLRRDEAPGKIMHEIRSGPAGHGGAREQIYYGSADATALFVMLLDELDRWGGLPDLDRARLVAAADRALEWIQQDGDRDGDGFVEYLRGAPTGLRNQGWKDSWDGIRFGDGALAEPPIALCEVQAYVYGAYIARARLATRAADHATATRWRAEATELADRFDAAFWCERTGGYVLALDAQKQQVDARASNMGHALWTGIALPGRAERIAASLLAADMWNGWGVRTLASSNPGYDPLSYHCGSVWPHDNALIAAGLARYGHRAEANRIALAQIDASEHFAGSLPELFAGFARDDVRVPVPYPTSCSPQAWSAAAPIAHLRTMVGLDVDDSGEPVVAPDVPERLGAVRLAGIRASGRLFEVSAQGRAGQVKRLQGR